MADNKEKHIHKYKRIKLGVVKVYRCVFPGCPHYLRRELVIGHKTICWRCDQEVTMTAQMAKQVKPHCRECNWSHVGEAGRQAMVERAAEPQLPQLPAKGAFEI